MYISKNKKSGIYYIYHRHTTTGKKTSKSTGTRFKSEALKYLSEFEKKLKQQSSQSTSFTMNELKIRYLGFIEKLNTRQSWNHSRKSIEKLIEVVGSDFQVRDLNKLIAQSFILNVYQRSKWSASLHLRHLKAVFNRAIEWGFIDKNPFNGIKLKIPVNNPVFINKKELELIVSKESNHILALLYRFAFYSGMRLSEIINLEWNDLDVKVKVIRVTNKSKRERVIPISKPLKKILKRIISKDGFVFDNNGKQFKPGYVSKSFKKSLRQTDLNDKIHFYTLRHSFASNLAQKGINLYVIQKLLGHSNITTTQIYSHLRTEDLVKAINELK